MLLYKAQCRLHTPTVTPLRGDTIWGHLCWGIRNHEGEKALEDFLAGYSATSLPVVFSDALPVGFLPKPQLKPTVATAEAHEEAEPSPGPGKSDYKRAKRIGFLATEAFDQTLSPQAILQLAGHGLTQDAGAARRERKRTHNSINRLSGTVQPEGGLFHSAETWPEDREGLFEIYVASQEEQKAVEQYLTLAFADGYGADRSTGYGRVSVTQVEAIEWPVEGNRMMCLGPFVSSAQVRDVRAETFTRFGRLGDVWAHHPNPFKRPIVMFEAGSTFSPSEKTSHSATVVGRILGDVHSDARIRHLAAAPAIAIRDGGYE